MLHPFVTSRLRDASRVVYFGCDPEWLQWFRQVSRPGHSAIALLPPRGGPWSESQMAAMEQRCFSVWSMELTGAMQLIGEEYSPTIAFVDVVDRWSLQVLNCLHGRNIPLVVRELEGVLDADWLEHRRQTYEIFQNWTEVDNYKHLAR